MGRKFAIAGIALVVAYVVGHLARSQLGIEMSSESIRQSVTGMGWKAPALFLAMMTFRQFLMVPAILLLPVGGLCFGPALGTLLGASGILLSALFTFAMARGLGAQWLQDLVGSQYAWLGKTVGRAGPLVVLGVTAHPTGPMSAIFWGAGFSSMALSPFLLAVTFGGSVRALAYSLFGSTLSDTGSPAFYVATGLLAVATLGPLAHPGIRRRLRSLGERDPRTEEAVIATSIVAPAARDGAGPRPAE